jgi:hypothetical protein
VTLTVRGLAIGLLRQFARLLWQAVVLVDVAVNRLVNGRVEMISTRAARARLRGEAWGCRLCRWLDFIDPGHCGRALRDPLGPLD